MKKAHLQIFIFLPLLVFAQKNASEEFSKEELKKIRKAEIQSQEYAYDAYKAHKAHKVLQSEVDYRKSISKDKNNALAQYNMGDVLFSQEAYKEAANYYREVSVNKKANKEEKHKAFHNLGNLAMKDKRYEDAVQYYKEALRNDSTDDETRYNFALAKEMLKKQQNQNKDNKDNKDQNKDNKDQNKNNKDQNKDNKDQNKDNKDQNKDNKDQNKDNKDQNKDNKNQDKDDKNQGSPEQDKNNSQDNPKNEDTPQDNRQPQSNNGKQEGELSSEQINRILNAINNEEKKTQEKLNAKKIKGTPIRTNKKDW